MTLTTQTPYKSRRDAYRLYRGITEGQKQTDAWLEADADEWEAAKLACALHLRDLETFVGRPVNIPLRRRYVPHRHREMTLP